jgi:lysophospholipase L1-like esterase
MVVHPIALVALLAIACGPAAGGGPELPPTRVLFVGNSLTSAWDLPELVATLSAAAGDTMEVASVTAGGASLDDHLARGAAERALREARWDVVVLQQGPTSTPEGGDQLEAAARRFAPLVRAAGARPALYAVWPTPDRVAFWDTSAANYARAAAAVDGLLLPAGDALRRALARDPGLPLLDADGFHPAPEGAYLVAITLVAALTGREPASLPGDVTWRGNRVAVPQDRLAAYQRAAREALDR